MKLLAVGFFVVVWNIDWCILWLYCNNKINMYSIFMFLLPCIVIIQEVLYFFICCIYCWIFETTYYYCSLNKKLFYFESAYWRVSFMDFCGKYSGIFENILHNMKMYNLQPQFFLTLFVSCSGFLNNLVLLKNKVCQFNLLLCYGILSCFLYVLNAKY